MSKSKENITRPEMIIEKTFLLTKNVKNIIVTDKENENKPQIGDYSTKSKIRFIEENEINFDKLTPIL